MKALQAVQAVQGAVPPRGAVPAAGKRPFGATQRVVSDDDAEIWRSVVVLVTRNKGSLEACDADPSLEVVTLEIFGELLH